MGNAVAPKPHTEAPIRGPHWCTWCVQPCPGHDELGVCLNVDREVFDQYRAWLRGEREQPTPRKGETDGQASSESTSQGACARPDRPSVFNGRSEQPAVDGSAVAAVPDAACRVPAPADTIVGAGVAAARGCQHSPEFFNANDPGAWRLITLLNGEPLPGERRTRVWAASVAEGWVDVVAVDAKGFAREQIHRDSQGRITAREPICDRYYGEVIIRRKAGL